MNLKGSFSFLVIDTHVHFYPHFDLDDFLHQTYQNLDLAFKKQFPIRESVKVIYLMNSSIFAGYDFFLHLARIEMLCEWEISLLSDQKTLVAKHRETGRHLWICPAFQYTHVNGLELLALGLGQLPSTQMTLSELAFEILSLGGIPVLPYGFGKWSGSRLKIVRHMIEDFKDTSFCVGDSPARCFPFDNGTLFSRITSDRVRVFPGSDPLPLDGEEKYSGTCGIIIPDITLELSKLTYSLSQMLRDPLVRFVPFMGKKSCIGNYYRQCLLRLTAKRFKKLKLPLSPFDGLEKLAPDIHSSGSGYQTRFSGQTGKWFLHVQGRCVQLQSRCVGEKRVLDVGGGHGQLIPYYLAEKFKVTVFGSTGSPRECIEEYITSKAIDWVEGSLLQLPFGNKSYPLVVSIRLCAHMRNTQLWVSELCRVASDTVIIDASMWLSFNILTNILFPLKKAFEPNTREYKMFTRNALTNMFRQAGFYLDQCEKQFFFPMAFHRKLNNALQSDQIEGICKRMGATSMFGSPAIMRFRRKIRT